MTTSYDIETRVDAEIDNEPEFGDLDGLFDEPVDSPFAEPDFERETLVTVEVTPVSPAAISETEPVAAEGDDWTTPDSSALWVRFGRTVRTIAPLVAADVVALTLCGLFAHALLRIVHLTSTGLVSWPSACALLPLIVAYWLAGLYSEIWVHPVIEFRQLTHVSTVCMVAAAAGGMLAPPFALWCALAWPVTVVMVPLLRTLARHCCVDRAGWGYPTLVIGSGDGAAALARMLLDVPRAGLRPVLLTDPQSGCRAAVVPVVNDPATLESILRAEGIRHAVVSLPEFSISRLTGVMDRYSGLIPHLLILSDTSTLPTLWGASRSGGRLSGIEVRNGLLMATLQLVKRMIDLSVAVTVLAVTLPLLLAVALLVKLTSPGPIFFSQTRIGRHGRRFKAWKFRTMHVNADVMLRQYLERVVAARQEWQRDHKLRKDPRVTRPGNWLRKWSLDELPQIWNVLKGEMSLVGPRPIVESEIPRYGDVFRPYTTVKPGITGLWQVSGRTNVSYDDRVRLDQFYIRHWSPWLDAYILAKTVIVLLRRDGAY